MISKTETNIARENWIKASTILQFRLITPYIIDIKGVKKEVFAFLPEYGSPNGTIVCLTSPPNFEIDKSVIDWAKRMQTYFSFINLLDFQEFDKEKIGEILSDWMKF